jgi:hypothetical protein
MKGRRFGRLLVDAKLNIHTIKKATNCVYLCDCGRRKRIDGASVDVPSVPYAGVQQTACILGANTWSAMRRSPPVTAASQRVPCMV